MLLDADERKIKTASRYRRRVGGIYELPEHPEFCPAVVHKGPSKLSDEPLKTGDNKLLG
jgi:hypothetical protein